MNTLTTVKAFADVRQVLRGYAAAHPPEAEDYYDRRLAERAAAKAKEKKSASRTAAGCQSAHLCRISATWALILTVRRREVPE